MGDRRADERGAGVVATMLALPVVLVLALFAIQVAARLHAHAELEALATHAGRTMAVHGRPSSAQAATAALRAALGRAGSEADIRWSSTDGTVAVRIEMAPPAVLDTALIGPLADPLVVEIRTRRERWR